MTDDSRPREDLQPGSWTEAEVDALASRRVRFRDGRTGTIRTGCGLVRPNNTIFVYAVEATPDGGETIILTKGDAEGGGDWSFTVLSDPPATKEALAALPGPVTTKLCKMAIWAGVAAGPSEAGGVLTRWNGCRWQGRCQGLIF